jgi:hypothetical protein
VPVATRETSRPRVPEPHQRARERRVSVDWGLVFWIAVMAYAILSALGLVLVGRASATR